MADFLDTQGMSNALNEIIKNAQKELFLVSPYLRFSQLVYDRLCQATRQDVTVHIIYGKSELHPLELAKLQSLKVNLYFKENLHAKCYLNENYALVGSMNLHQYSETHNEEMGVLLHNYRDSKAYQACFSQVQYILNNAKLLQQQAVNNPDRYEFNPKVFYPLWLADLQLRYPTAKFQKEADYYIAQNGLMNDVHLSTRYGFITVELPFEKQVGKKLKEYHEQELSNLFVDYRWYWSSPFDRIYLYHAKDHNARSMEEDLDYCRQGERLLADIVKRMFRNYWNGFYKN